MKKFNFLFSAFMAASMAFSFYACSDDDNNGNGPNNPPTTDYHFDLFLTVEEHGGMNRGKGTIVKSVESVTADEPVIDIYKDGVQFRSSDNVYSMEAITRGKYYYEVPNSGDRFSKLQVVGNTVNIIQEQKFKENTFKVRAYTHAWLDNETLLIMAANGQYDKIIWTKLHTDESAKDMTILEEGILDLPLPDEKAKAFTSTGILTYNEKAGKLYYFYFGKVKSGMGASTSNFYTAVINPTTMTIETNIMNTLAAEMAGSAYGQLMQNCVMYDEEGNLYLAAYTDTNDIEQGHLLRINKGESDFDPSYEGFPNAEGKLLTVQYVGNGKAVAYSRKDALGTAIGSFSHFYSIIDLKTGTCERLKYNGQELPYSAGRFSQRTAVLDGKAYIGVSTETGNPTIYIYDSKNGTIDKGREISRYYYFDMIRVMESNKKTTE